MVTDVQDYGRGIWRNCRSFFKHRVPVQIQFFLCRLAPLLFDFHSEIPIPVFMPVSYWWALTPSSKLSMLLRSTCNSSIYVYVHGYVFSNCIFDLANADFISALSNCPDVSCYKAMYYHSNTRLVTVLALCLSLWFCKCMVGRWKQYIAKLLKNTLHLEVR